jgi:hypothetical protein
MLSPLILAPRARIAREGESGGKARLRNDVERERPVGLPSGSTTIAPTSQVCAQKQSFSYTRGVVGEREDGDREPRP